MTTVRNKNKNKNRFNYFLSQCNETPLSEEWRSVFGEITEETIKQYKFKITNPDDYHEAIRFAEVLDQHLKKPARYFDQVYKKYLKAGQIPTFVSSTIDELLKDDGFKLAVYKERCRLGIPVSTGIPICEFPSYTNPANEATLLQKGAVLRVSLHAGLLGSTWREFFSYLLLHNYVMPVTHLDIKELLELAGNKELIGRLLNKIYNKVRPLPLHKRQANIAISLSVNLEEIAAKQLEPSLYEMGLEGGQTRISRSSKSLLRRLLGDISLSKATVGQHIEAIKRRGLRQSKKFRDELMELQKDFNTDPKYKGRIEIPTKYPSK